MKKPAKPPAVKAQFWIIDTDSSGETHGTFEASGPHPTIAAAEAAIIAEIRELWTDSCPCLKGATGKQWCKPFHIVEVRRTVQPDIVSRITLATI